MATLATEYNGEQKFAFASTRHEHNACLSALPPEAFSLLKPYLSKVTLSHGTVLWEAGQPASTVYFPVSGLISVLLPMSTGAAVEVATVSRQGAAGSILDARAEKPATRGVVQIDGLFAQIAADRLRDIAAHSPAVDCMLDLCRDWLAAQAQQIAACNAVHDASKRICRWLVHNALKMESTNLHVTQAMLGSLMSLRRTTVTLVARQLYAQGLIDYSRGKLRVNDLVKLEAAACECCRALGQPHWPAVRLAAFRFRNFLAETSR